MSPNKCFPFGPLGDAPFLVKSHKGRENGMGSIGEPTVRTALQDFVSHWPCHLYILILGNMPFVPGLDYWKALHSLQIEPFIYPKSAHLPYLPLFLKKSLQQFIFGTLQLNNK